MAFLYIDQKGCICVRELRVPVEGAKDNILTISHHANQIKTDATLKELKILTKNLEKIWPSFI